MKKTILVVEDNKTIRDALEMILIDHGYKVVVAEDGLRAYIRANILKPDLILMDILLPHSSGLQVAEDIKDIDVPIVFMTAQRGKGLREECEKCKYFINFLEKPLNIDMLLEILKEYFDKKGEIV